MTCSLHLHSPHTLGGLRDLLMERRACPTGPLGLLEDPSLQMAHGAKKKSIAVHGQKT